MNTPNNKWSHETKENITSAFLSLLQDRELFDITVTDICNIAGIERSTFYAHFEDVSDLANAYAAEIEKQVSRQPHTDNDFSWIFDYIKEHLELFDSYFKLGVRHVSSDYKNIFFRSGVYSVTKMWFEGGCIEPSEQMNIIIKREYDKIFK